ncbi:MAG: hypothetical protein ACRC80_11970 [Waterburya sp.]
MGININDLQPLDSSLLSGSNKALGNLRELLPKELKITGGKKDDQYCTYAILNSVGSTPVLICEDYDTYVDSYKKLRDSLQS